MKLIKLLILFTGILCSITSYGQSKYIAIAEKECSCFKEIDLASNENERWKKVMNCFKSDSLLNAESMQELQAEFPQLSEADYVVMLTDSVNLYLTNYCPAYSIVTKSFDYEASEEIKVSGNRICNCLPPNNITEQQLNDCFQLEITHLKKQGKAMTKNEKNIVKSSIKDYLATFCSPYIEFQLYKEIKSGKK